MRTSLLTLIVGVVLLGSVVPATAVGAGAGAPASLGAPASVADAADGRANATEITSGEEVTGELHRENPADWYAVELDEGEAVRVVGSAGMGDVQFSVVGPDGSRLDAINASAIRTAVGTVAWTGGTYYVRASTPEDGIGGGYDLTVTVGDDDRYEPNDDATDAAVIGGDTEAATLVEDDEDWYAVRADAGDLITASALRTDGGGTDIGQGFLLQVVSPEGEYVGLVGDDAARYNNRTEGSAIIDDGADTAFQRAVAETDGTYYLRVVPVSQPGASLEGLVGYEVATTARTPTRLGVNESVDGSLAAPTTDAHDVYALDATANETLRVATETRNDGEFVVSVYGADGAELASESVSSATTINATVGSDGPAYVVARLPTGAADTDYTLSVDVPGRPADEGDETAGNVTDDGGNGTATPASDDENGTVIPAGDDGNGTATPAEDDGGNETTEEGNGTATPTSDGGDASGATGGDDTDDGAADSDDDESNDSDESDDTGDVSGAADGTESTVTDTATNTTTSTVTDTAIATDTPTPEERAGGAANDRASVAGDGVAGAGSVDGGNGVTADGLGPLMPVIALLVATLALLVRE